MEYIITKKIEAKDIIEAIKNEKDADIVNIEQLESENKKYGFAQ